jgi:hypothetical protein
MISFGTWIVMMVLYVIIYLSAYQMKDFASSRCSSQELCSVYGTWSTRACSSICEKQVANQLIGEVVLLTLICLAICMFMLNFMNALYKKITLFDERFPDAFALDENEELHDEQDAKEEEEEKLLFTPTIAPGLEDPKAESDAPFLKIAPSSVATDFGGLDEEKREPSFSSSFKRIATPHYEDAVRPTGASQIEERPAAPSSAPVPGSFKKVCGLEGCGQEAFDLQCPLCNKSENPPADSFFCCQEHFDKAWKTAHKTKYHAVKKH